MEAFGLSINSLISTVLLLTVYVLGVGITALIARAVGKKFLPMDSPQHRDTYWTDLHLTRESIEKYYRQF